MRSNYYISNNKRCGFLFNVDIVWLIATIIA